jgi:hypothetical protein
MEQSNLIRRVFGTPDGKQLLKRLGDEYVYSPILSNEDAVVYRRLGKADLVLLFLNTVYREGEIHERQCGGNRLEAETTRESTQEQNGRGCKD